MKIQDKIIRYSGKLFTFLCIFCCVLSLGPVLSAEEKVVDIPALLEPVGVKMDCVEAYRGEIFEIDVYDAAVVPYVEEVYFSVGGTVEEIHVVVGQQVKAGDALITLNHEAQITKMEALQEQISVLEKNALYADALAEIDLEILNLELEKLAVHSEPDAQAIALKKLEIEEKILAVDFDIALRDRQLAQLKEELRLLEAETSQAVLVAPFDGQVMFSINLKKGSYVSAFNPLIYLADPTRLSIQSEYISPSILRGAEEIYALIGNSRLSLTHIPVDTAEYLSKVLAGEIMYSHFSIDEPADADISCGLYAALCLISEPIPDALLIPANALYSDGAGGRYIYVIQNGERIRRSVKVGRTTDWEVQILEGLEEGEIVYVKE